MIKRQNKIRPNGYNDKVRSELEKEIRKVLEGKKFRAGASRDEIINKLPLIYNKGVSVLIPRTTVYDCLDRMMSFKIVDCFTENLNISGGRPNTIFFLKEYSSVVANKLLSTYHIDVANFKDLNLADILKRVAEVSEKIVINTRIPVLVNQSIEKRVGKGKKYENRATFIRIAIKEKLEREGF